MFVEVAEIAGPQGDEEQFDRELADVMRYAFNRYGIGFQFIDERREVDDDYEVGNVIAIQPCRADYMAGQLCMLPSGHEGSHR